MIVTRWTAERIGMILEGSSTRTADDLHAAVILLAVGEGWDTPDGAEIDARDLYAQDAPRGVYWAQDVELGDALAEGAELATMWLDEHIAPEGYGFVFDDGFLLLPLDEI